MCERAGGTCLGVSCKGVCGGGRDNRYVIIICGVLEVDKIYIYIVCEELEGYWNLYSMRVELLC